MNRAILKHVIVGFLFVMLLHPVPEAMARKKKTRRPSKKASRAATQIVVRKVISLEQRTVKPTFSSQELRLVNRDRMVVLGNGLMGEQETMYLLRLDDLQQQTVQVPLERFVRGNPGIKLSEQDTRPVHEQFQIRRLLFYDPAVQEAGIEVEDRFGNDRVRRHFFIHWDLKQGLLTEATLVARGRPGKSFSDSLPLGYDHTRREYYFVRQIYSTKGKGEGRTVTVVGFKAGKPRVVAQFTSHRALQDETLLDLSGRRALMLEYAELADMDPTPRGFLVQLDSGKTLGFEIPLTAYGATFGPDGKRLYIYSAELGELWTVDAATGARIGAVLKVGKLGHALGLVDQRHLLLLRSSGLRFFSLGSDGLKPGTLVPMSRLYEGFSHVGGSLVLPGGALVKNGDRLYITSVSGR